MDTGVLVSNAVAIPVDASGGAGVATALGKAAAAAMGIKPGFPAKKALDQYRKMGAAQVNRAISLLAQADLDLRGAKEWPDALVMEVLVARLSRLVVNQRR